MMGRWAGGIQRGLQQQGGGQGLWPIGVAGGVRRTNGDSMSNLVGPMQQGPQPFGQMPMGMGYGAPPRMPMPGQLNMGGMPGRDIYRQPMQLVDDSTSQLGGPGGGGMLAKMRARFGRQAKPGDKPGMMGGGY